MHNSLYEMGLQGIMVVVSWTDCNAGTTAEEQNLLVNISTSRASLLQGQYLLQEK